MKLLKNLTVSLGLVLTLSVGVGGVAQAHVLKQNNGISGVLHIEPNDDPQAGEPTKLGISFADKAGGFSLPDCDCQLSLMQDGKVLQAVSPKPALSGATLDSSATVTFPSIGVYEIVVTGSPKSHTFPSFRLDYTIRVASGVASAPVNSKSNSGSTMLIIAVGSFAVLAMIAFVAIGQGGRYKTAPQSVKTIKSSPKTK